MVGSGSESFRDRPGYACQSAILFEGALVGTATAGSRWNTLICRNPTALPPSVVNNRAAELRSIRRTVGTLEDCDPILRLRRHVATTHYASSPTALVPVAATSTCPRFARTGGGAMQTTLCHRCQRQPIRRFR